MKNRSVLVSRILYSLVALGVLLNLFLRSQDMFSRLVMSPFLIGACMILVENISLYFNKKDFAHLCHKLFVISFLFFWFGFLIFWCYSSLINQDYMLLLFSIPFWLVGIYLINKYLFKREISLFKSKFNFKMVIGIILVGACLIIGPTLMFIGIKDTYELNQIKKNYTLTTAYYDHYGIYDSDEDGTTYKLTYIYTVDGQDYTITTDYGTNYIPEGNSVREIRYHPENPSKAVFEVSNRNNGIIFMGAFFTLGSLVFVLAGLTVLGYFDKFKIDVVGTFIGFVFLVFGIGIILLQNGETGSFIETVKSFGLWILIPIMFIMVGTYQLINCLILKK